MNLAAALNQKGVVMRIGSVINFKSGKRHIEIFGHVSNGIPGLEICGLGGNAKIIKEKFVFLSKNRNLKIPLKKFTLSLDGPIDLKEATWDEVSDLELPLLIIFWSLAGFINLRRLHECITWGQVSSSGNIFQRAIECKEINQLPGDLTNKSKIIWNNENENGYLIIKTGELLETVPGLKIKTGTKHSG